MKDCRSELSNLWWKMINLSLAPKWAAWLDVLPVSVWYTSFLTMTFNYLPCLYHSPWPMRWPVYTQPFTPDSWVHLSSNTGFTRKSVRKASAASCSARVIKQFRFTLSSISGPNPPCPVMEWNWEGGNPYLCNIFMLVWLLENCGNNKQSAYESN